MNSDADDHTDIAGLNDDTAANAVSNDAGDHPSPQDSMDASPAAQDHEDDASRSAAVPLQKRRRVTRACDECRRKKIKCDGKQPCTHCTVYSYECTYDQPSNRRRNAPPQYVESLESKLNRATALIRMILPNADLNDPNLEEKFRQLTFSTSSMRSTPTPLTGALTEEPETGIDDHLESMVKSTGQLDLDEQGNIEYHGHSSGLTFVRRMRESLGDVMGPEGKGTPFVKSRPMSQVFDSPRSFSDKDSWEPLPGADLPPRELAREMCDITINEAGAILRFVHYPTFVKQMENLYDLTPENYTNEENMFLPLLYSVLAVATLFQRGDGSGLDEGYEKAISEGFKYFKQCRQLMDIADIRDLRQLQALTFMILFLQSSAKLSVCYAYIGVALRSALRMGLHRCFTDNFSVIEAETRKRVFWVIRKMDTYVGALLGLPHSLEDDQIDQEFPAEVDDEYITENRIIPMPEGRISSIAAANAHTTLVQILAKIVKYIYPVTAPSRTNQGRTVKSYSVSHAKIVEIEHDLQQWQDQLPLPLKPGGEASRIVLRCQHLLRMAYAHAQMMLYRPFLHYVSQTQDSRKVDKRSYACAAACVSVSRNIVHIAVEMKKRGLLGGAYWFSMYTTFFAILSLVFYALENPDNEASQDVLKVAKEGKDTLVSLANRSMAADRCSATLKALFEQLPDHGLARRKSSSAARKRRPNATHSLKRDINEISTAPQGKQPKLSTSTAQSQTPPQPLSQQPASSYDLSDLQYATAHGFFDVGQSFQSTPDRTLNAAFSPQQEVFSNSPSLPQSSFPLADLSSMMFPNPEDPFAYPSQSAEFNYETLLKSVNGNDAINYPFAPPTTKEQLSRTGFVPPSSTFMYGAGPADQQMSSQYEDVQLLGPMPAYMMQGSRNVDSPSTASLPLSSNPTTNGSPSQQQIQNDDTKFFTNGIPIVNLNALLGGEEWNGLPPDRNAMASAFNANINEGSFRKRGGTSTQRQQGQQPSVQFQDMAPGMLGWGLEGF